MALFFCLPSSAFGKSSFLKAATSLRVSQVIIAILEVLAFSPDASSSFSVSLMYACFAVRENSAKDTPLRNIKPMSGLRIA